jgi:CubicO group peptidase (beta-lactamase class C family)
MHRRRFLALLATGGAVAAGSTIRPWTHAATPAHAARQDFLFPDTPVGRVFRQWLAAYNAADIEALRAFHRANSPADEVEGRTALDLIFRRRTGGIDPYGVIRSEDFELTIVGRSRLTELWIEGLMAVSPDPPHHLLGLGGRPVAAPGDQALGEPLTDDDLRAELDRYLRKLTAADAFAGTVLVARDGAPLYTGGFGLADREAGVPNGVETRFNLGSMNKMFTAVAIAQLVEGGAIALHEPVGRYLADLPPAIAGTVTVHHLLTHTSGLGDFFGPEFERVKETLRSPRDYFPLFIDRPLRFAPGERWDYSNAGFILLGAIIETAGGEDYFDYIRAHVYAPAGMTASDSYEKHAAVPDLARGYTNPLPPDPADLRAEDAFKPLVDNLEILPRMGSSAGGGYSTVTDLLRFDRALRAGRLVSPPMAETLMTGKVSLPFDDGERYGYGFQEERYRGTRISGHGGGFPGVSSKLDIYLDLGYTVAVLANVDGGAQPVVAKIRELLVRE